jgi:Fe-S cluster assembly protein SufD
MSPSLQPSAVPDSAALRSFAAQWHSRSADSLSPLREQAMRRFLKLGLPTVRDETWRYTNLRNLAAQNFVDAPRKPHIEIEPGESLSLLGSIDRSASLLIVNGYPTLPAADGFMSGIEVHSLRELARLYRTRTSSAGLCSTPRFSSTACI